MAEQSSNRWEDPCSGIYCPDGERDHTLHPMHPFCPYCNAINEAHPQFINNNGRTQRSHNLPLFENSNSSTPTPTSNSSIDPRLTGSSTSSMTTMPGSTATGPRYEYQPYPGALLTSRTHQLTAGMTGLAAIAQKNQELNEYEDRMNPPHAGEPSRRGRSSLYSKGDKRAKSKADNGPRQLKMFVVLAKQSFEFRSWEEVVTNERSIIKHEFSEHCKYSIQSYKLY